MQEVPHLKLSPYMQRDCDDLAIAANLGLAWLVGYAERHTSETVPPYAIQQNDINHGGLRAASRCGVRRLNRFQRFIGLRPKFQLSRGVALKCSQLELISSIRRASRDRCSLPFNRAGGFAGDVVDDAVDTSDFVDDAGGGITEEGHVERVEIRCHAIDRRDGA